jgi:hypothetical protein
MAHGSVTTAAALALRVPPHNAEAERGVLGDDLAAQAFDVRMHDGVEVEAGALVAEGELAHRGAVQGPIRCHNAGAEAFGDGTQGRAAGGDSLAGEAVGVHDRRAEGREPVGDGGLSCGDVAGEAYDAHR